MIKQCLLIFTLLFLTISKRVNTKIKLNRIKEWHYFAKFGGEIGRNDYELKLRILGLENEPNRELNLKMELYLDEEWPLVLATPECQRHPHTRRVEPFTIPTDGNYSKIFNGYLSQGLRAHMWYFALTDCDNSIKSTLSSNEIRSAKLEIDFHILNTGDTEFSIEQFGMLQLQTLLTIFDIFMLIYNARLMFVKYKKYDEFSLALFFLVCTLCLETFQYIFNLVHLSVYSYNGKGIVGFYVVASILQICTQFGLTMILVMLSWGWYINFIKFDNFELFLPLSLLIGFFQATIVGVGFIDHDSYYKDHNYEGWVGWLATSIFICEFIYFIYGVKNTYKKENTKVKDFIIQLGIYGGLYFLSFPLLQTINLIVARYYRYRVMEIGTMAFRTGALVLLTRLFTSNKSVFAEISYENKSFLDRNKDD